MKDNKFTKAERNEIAKFLTQKHTAYNIGIGDGKGWSTETQIDFQDNPDDFIDTLEQVIAEIDFPKTEGMLTFVRTVSIDYIEPDHYLAAEGMENKQFPAPEWKELPTVTIYVPSQNQILQIAEGSGDNLSAEDMENGIVDYIYYSQYKLDDLTEEYDGGQIDKTEMVRDTYSSLTEAIPEVLNFAFDDASLKYIVLEQES